MTDYYNLMKQISDIHIEWCHLGYLSEEEAYNKIKRIIIKEENNNENKMENF